MPLDVLDRFLRPLRRGRVTSDYPVAAPDLPPAARGLPVLNADACSMTGVCATVCPTRAIEVSGGRWQLDAGRCVMCDACVAACPTGALRHAGGIELAARRRRELVVLHSVPAAAPEVPATDAAEAPHDPEERDEARDGARVAPRDEAREAPRDEAREAPRGPEALAEVRVEAGDEAGDRLASAIRRSVGRSLHIRHLDTGSCNGCDWEINALLNPYHDVQRFGIDFVASPRHADLLLVTGTMTRNLELAALRTYEAMPEPRLVVAVGACAIGGGVFAGSYAARDGIGEVLPVDVWVPGCPPRPEALIQGLLLAMDRWVPRG
jgi:Ni,Fe-hydrogenase III small subunit/formate hydrogenlyase subunit 6/NADH:ubiquinone oxidoreductase subunit I